MKKPTVCLVGRPNTGKSTIFNKLIKKRVSIIEDAPGVTRDRIYGTVNYKNYSFNLIDTGGIDLEKNDFNEEIKMQVEIAINESDVIVFVLDGKETLTSNDLLVRDMLRKSGKKVICAINKVDNKKVEEKGLQESRAERQGSAGGLPGKSTGCPERADTEVAGIPQKGHRQQAQNSHAAQDQKCCERAEPVSAERHKRSPCAYRASESRSRGFGCCEHGHRWCRGTHC